MTVRIVDGLGADAAAAVLRKAGLEVEIVHPPKVLAFWQLCTAYAAGDAIDVQWSLANPACRDLWRGVSEVILARPFLDPEIVALMDLGEFVYAPEPTRSWASLAAADELCSPALIRADGSWMLSQTVSNDEATPVSDRFAAMWLDEFDDG